MAALKVIGVSYPLHWSHFARWLNSGRDDTHTHTHTHTLDDWLTDSVGGTLMPHRAAQALLDGECAKARVGITTVGKSENGGLSALHFAACSEIEFDNGKFEVIPCTCAIPQPPRWAGLLRGCSVIPELYLPCF
jgi:hypothetical protein